MWRFWRKQEQQGGSESVRDTLRAYGDRLYELEREVKDLRLDGAAMYEKTLKLHERLRQRAAKLEQGLDEEPQLDLNETIRAGGDPRRRPAVQPLRRQA